MFAVLCVMDVKEIKRDSRLSLALHHLVIDRASLFTEQGKSVLPIRVTNKHFTTICESILVTIFPRISILLF